MKITKEHYAIIESAVKKVLANTPNAYEEYYYKNGLSDQRFRWDCLWAAQINDFLRDVIYPYANDDKGDQSMTTPMKELHLPIAEGLSGHNPKPVKIIIAHKIKTFGSVNTLCKLHMYYDEQAYLLADALLLSLPQGVIEPLIIHLLKNRVSLYSGTMVKETNQ